MTEEVKMTRKEVIVDRLQEIYAEEHRLSHELWNILWKEKSTTRE